MKSHLKLYQIFSSDIALRLNGNITKLFALKFGILAANLVPLALAKTLPVRRDISSTLSGVEKALAIRAFHVGGLGRSLIYEINHGDSTENPHENVTDAKPRDSIVQIYPLPRELGLNSYELVRLGYIVYGNKFLISLDDWDRVSMLVGFRSFYHLWNHRVIVFRLTPTQGPFSVIDLSPILLRVDAPELLRIRVWDISAYAIKC